MRNLLSPRAPRVSLPPEDPPELTLMEQGRRYLFVSHQEVGILPDSLETSLWEYAAGEVNTAEKGNRAYLVPLTVYPRLVEEVNNAVRDHYSRAQE